MFGPASPYDSEHRTVFVVRLAVHLAGCAMIFTGSASHAFLAINRKLLLLSLGLLAACMAMEEVYAVTPDPTLRAVKLVSFKAAESCLSALVLLGCLLLRALTLRETYRLSALFFVALSLHLAVLLTDNTIKLGYLGNAIIAAAALVILRDFLTAFQDGGGQAVSNVRALMHLQAVLTLLNAATFVGSFYGTVFGLKLAQYVLQIFAITLFYLFVRPFLEADGPKANGGMELLVSGKA